ncbi:MAG: hypothetical protein KY464_10350, partial [Gemmatimonadetes bacterium]|nr:hypothetical protein [Gemmatimonadota bacterium]
MSPEIGRNRGSLDVGEHVLTVPAGAVDEPAIFAMRKAPGSVTVELTAMRRKLNDVGQAGQRSGDARA